MIEKEKIIQVIFDAIDELNEQISSEKKLEKSLDTALFGKASKLDSLDLVNLVTAIEEGLDDQFDIFITLANEKAVSQKNSPFRTVETLVNYALTLLEEDHANS